MASASGKLATRPRRRTEKRTRRIEWLTVTASDVLPGDRLPQGMVLARDWGGPLGLRAWRFVVAGQPRPLWHAADEMLVCRRGDPSLVPPGLPGVVGHIRTADRIAALEAMVDRAGDEIERRRRFPR